jgi:hypothetical protein
MAEVAGVYTNSNAPDIEEYQVTAAQTFIRGAVLIAASGKVSEAGANPAANTVVGVAMADAFSGPGYNAANTPSPITWQDDRIPVAIASSPRNIFVSRMCNNTTDSTLATVALTDVNVQYGITKQATGNSAGAWWPDRNKTAANARIVILKADPDANLVHWKFLASAVNA